SHSLPSNRKAARYTRRAFSSGLVKPEGLHPKYAQQSRKRDRSVNNRSCLVTIDKPVSNPHQRTRNVVDFSSPKSRFFTPRILFLGLSVIANVLCAWAGAAHYRKLAWGDVWQPIGWLLSIFFLLLAFLPRQSELAAGF